MNRQELDERWLQSRIVRARVDYAADALKRGDAPQAERLYKQALAHAEVLEGGGDGILSGIALIGLFDLYDRERREIEAEEAWERVRRILIKVLAQ